MHGRFSKAAPLCNTEKGLQAEKVYSHADARLMPRADGVYLYMNLIHQSMRKFHLIFGGIRTMSADPTATGTRLSRALRALDARGLAEMARIIGAIATSH